MPATHVATTVQIFIVVVSADTAVATTVQKFIARCGGSVRRFFQLKLKKKNLAVVEKEI